MYPLNVSNAAIGGFAVANDEQEHRALTALGYEPALTGAEPETPAGVVVEDAGHTVESVRAQLDAAGIAYDGRWGLARLIEALPK